MDKIEKKLYTFGFETYQLAFFETQDFQNLKKFFTYEIPKFEILKVKACSFNQITQLSQNFVKSHTDNVNIAVPYLHNENLKKTLIENFGKKPNNYQEILDFINPYIENKNILNITPNIIPNNFQYGSAKYYYIYGNLKNPNFYKKLPPLLYDIILNGTLNEFSIPIYIHEIYHALSKRNKGYTKNYLYDEIIPILMEQISSLELNLSHHTFLKKINQTKNDIIDNSIESQKYIISFLYANTLFNLYQNPKFKTEINKEINKILIGKQKLEDVLNKYEITPEQGANIVKRQIKTMK